MLSFCIKKKRDGDSVFTLIYDLGFSVCLQVCVWIVNADFLQTDSS